VLCQILPAHKYYIHTSKTPTHYSLDTMRLFIYGWICILYWRWAAIGSKAVVALSPHIDSGHVSRMLVDAMLHWNCSKGSKMVGGKSQKHMPPFTAVSWVDSLNVLISSLYCNKTLSKRGKIYFGSHPCSLGSTDLGLWQTSWQGKSNSKGAHIQREKRGQDPNILFKATPPNTSLPPTRPHLLKFSSPSS
jgi:hypothetical protein